MRCVCSCTKNHSEQLSKSAHTLQFGKWSALRGVPMLAVCLFIIHCLLHICSVFIHILRNEEISHFSPFPVVIRVRRYWFAISTGSIIPMAPIPFHLDIISRECIVGFRTGNGITWVQEPVWKSNYWSNNYVAAKSPCHAYVWKKGPLTFMQRIPVLFLQSEVKYCGNWPSALTLWSSNLSQAGMGIEIWTVKLTV